MTFKKTRLISLEKWWTTLYKATQIAYCKLYFNSIDKPNTRLQTEQQSWISHILSKSLVIIQAVEIHYAKTPLGYRVENHLSLANKSHADEKPSCDTTASICGFKVISSNKLAKSKLSFSFLNTHRESSGVRNLFKITSSRSLEINDKAFPAHATRNRG